VASYGNEYHLRGTFGVHSSLLDDWWSSDSGQLLLTCLSLTCNEVSLVTPATSNCLHLTKGYYSLQNCRTGGYTSTRVLSDRSRQEWSLNSQNLRIQNTLVNEDLWIKFRWWLLRWNWLGYFGSQRCKQILPFLQEFITCWVSSSANFDWCYSID